MREVTRRLAKCAALPASAARLALAEPSSALLAARMAAWVVALSLFVRLMPLPRALRLVSPKRPGRDARPPSRDRGDEERVKLRLARVLDSVLAADLWVFTPTCWKRATVLHRYLALSGIETRIRFGLRRDGDAAPAGHAWLEADGVPLLEGTPPDYKVTYSYPS